MHPNLPEGKQILATLRGGDYAHPGEEEAIALVLDGIPVDPGSRVLDVGCGRGGTADWIRRQGWTAVVGVDRDSEAIGVAQQRYPLVDFRSCDVRALPEADLGRFDLIVLFNSFYAFTDQAGALRNLREVARAGAQLCLFDYAQASAGSLPKALGDAIGTPIRLDTIDEQLAGAGWQQQTVVDLTDRYVDWYRTLLDKLAAGRTEITARHGVEWYEYFARWYGALHEALIAGQLRGVLIRAVAVPMLTPC